MVLYCCFGGRHVLPQENTRWHFLLVVAALFLLLASALLLVHWLGWRLLADCDGIRFIVGRRTFWYDDWERGQFRQLLVKVFNRLAKINPQIGGIDDLIFYSLGQHIDWVLLFFLLLLRLIGLFVLGFQAFVVLFHFGNHFPIECRQRHLLDILVLANEGVVEVPDDNVPDALLLHFPGVALPGQPADEDEELVEVHAGVPCVVGALVPMLPNKYSYPYFW